MADSENTIPPIKQKKKSLDRAKKRLPGVAVVFAILAVIIAALATVILTNPLGMRDKYMRGFLKNIPVVKNLLPAEDPGEPVDLSPDQLMERIAALEKEAAAAQNSNDDLSGKIRIYLNEIARLKEIEAQQLQFRQNKEEFDNMIAMGDTMAYQKFFEQISPDTAAELYKLVLGINVSQTELKNFVATYAAMDASDAAKIFDILTGAELDLVALILTNMTPDARGEVLARMTPDNAAAVTKRMTPS